MKKRSQSNSTSKEHPHKRKKIKEKTDLQNANDECSSNPLPCNIKFSAMEDNTSKCRGDE